MGMMPSVITVEAHDNSDGYPYNVAAGSYVADQWGFYQCECTSFVAWCLNARNGFGFSNRMYGSDDKWGNAKNWGDVARRHGFAVDGNPAVGAIAWSSSGTYGHVAWVCAVNGDNVTIDEYNNGWVTIAGEKHGNHKYTTRTEHKSTFQYIHLKDIPVGNNPIGDLNNVEGGTNTVWVRGWAFDQDDVSRSIEVHVYIGGPAGTGEGHAIIADTRREDVNNAYGSGIYHGYDATIRTSRVGTQTVYVYAINVGGGTNTLIETKTVTIAQDATPPTISDVDIKDVNSEGYTVTCCVKDAEGIAKVQFPTWTVANGQDDLAEDWQNNPSCSGTQDGATWSFRVHDKDHDFERGIYRTHIYAWDNNGNCTCYELNNIEFQNAYSPANTVSYDGHTYDLYNDIMTWDEAKAKCEELGGHLVTITSAEEQETVAGLIQGQARTGYWIGGSSKYGSTWVTGEEFSFSNWEPGEPNLDGGEDSYGIYTGTGTWNDWSASNKSVVTNKSIGLGFICEWDAKLEAAKESGKTELENYKSASDYRPAQQEELRKAIAEGVAAIDAASDEAGVSRALAEAKATMDAIKTDAQLTAEETAAHTHSYGTEWKADNKSHWKACSCGAETGRENHDFGDWVTDKEATATETGTKHKVCRTCSYREEGTIPATGESHTHEYRDWQHNDTQHWKGCSCGDETDRGNHDFGDWVTDKEATATETGTKHRVCQTCSYREEGTIPATGESHTHEYGDWQHDSAQHWKACSCGDETDRGNHDFGDWVTEKEATATETGTKHRVCQTCSYREEGSIPATGESHTHEYGDWQYNDMQHWKACSCGDETDRGNHDFGDWVTDKEATATETGTKHRVCQTCSYREEGTIPATGGGGGNSGDNANPDENDNGSSNNDGNGSDNNRSETAYDSATAPVRVNSENQDNIVKEVTIKAENTFNAVIAAAVSELADIVLTPEEKQLAEDGANIKIVLDIQDVGNTVSAADKAVVEGALNIGTARGFAVGQYLDVNLFKVINESRNAIHETNRKIAVTMAVPERLKNTDANRARTYAVVRVHNGAAEVLTDLDDSDDTITIATDRFSTYAVIYKDTAGNSVNGNAAAKRQKDNEPKTGDSMHIELYATLSMIVGLIYVLMYYVDRKRGMSKETSDHHRNP